MPVNRSCQECGTRFETGNTRRVFCSDRCKMRYHRIALTCWYCGERADSVEHLFPQKYGDGSGDTVRACRECNSALGAIALTSVENRCIYLAQRIRKRYQLDKPIPEWSDNELMELGDNLRSAVKHKIYERQRAVERYLFLTARARTLR